MFAIFLFVVIFSFLCWLITPEKPLQEAPEKVQDSPQPTQNLDSEPTEIPLLDVQSLSPSPELFSDDKPSVEQLKAEASERYKSMTVKELKIEIERRIFKGAYWKSAKKGDLINLLAGDDIFVTTSK